MISDIDSDYHIRTVNELTVQNKYHWQKFAEGFCHFLQYRNQASEVRIQAHHRADPKGQAVSQWIDLECGTTLPRHSSLREATVDSGAVLGPRLVQVPTWGLETEPPRTKYQMIRRLSCRCLWQGQLPVQSGMQLQCQ